jgi:hypothetical protein
MACVWLLLMIALIGGRLSTLAVAVAVRVVFLGCAAAVIVFDPVAAAHSPAASVIFLFVVAAVPWHLAALISKADAALHKSQMEARRYQMLVQVEVIASLWPQPRLCLSSLPRRLSSGFLVKVHLQRERETERTRACTHTRVLRATRTEGKTSKVRVMKLPSKRERVGLPWSAALIAF